MGSSPQNKALFDGKDITCVAAATKTGEIKRMMNERKLAPALVGREVDGDTELGAPRRIPELEWTESEWFADWLRLAREGQAKRN